MNDPLFSIIVPIYKVEKYVRQCVESVIRQSWKDFELILVDDGSPDGCGRIIDEYARSDKRVRAIHRENGGIVNARRTGAAAARGKYVMNIDGDDYIEDGCLETLAWYANKYEADVYCFGFFNRTKTGADEVPQHFEEGLYDTEEKKNKILSKLIYDPDRKFFTFGMLPSIWSKVVKRELYVKWQMVVDTSVIVGEDFALTVPLMFDAGSIYVIGKSLYDYRVIEGSMSRRFNPNAANCLRGVVTTILDEAKIDPQRCKLRKQLGAYCAYMVFDHLYFAAKNAKSYGEYKSYADKFSEPVLNCMRSCPTRLDSREAVFETVFVKRRMWRILWITAKIMRRRKK